MNLKEWAGVRGILYQTTLWWRYTMRPPPVRIFDSHTVL